MDATEGAPAAKKTLGGRSWISFLLLAAAILVYVAIVGGPRRAPSGAEGPAIGRRLPYLRLEPLTGDSRSVSLDDLSGRVTLVNYWGTWCPPCVREFPQIVELAKKFADEEDFRLYAVSCGENSDDDDLTPLDRETQQFLKSKGVTLATYADQNAASRRALFNALRPELEHFSYPTTIVFDRQGTIRGFWQGYDPYAADEMSALVAELLRLASKESSTH
jgi:cytochrome c biogenesis protein CcmG/thiol:disulfide interchange protein DsbE